MRHLLPTRRVPAVAAARRLQALMVIGWSVRLLSEQLGCGATAVPKLVYCAQPTVTVSLDGRISALYEDLWDRTGPSKVTRTRALARGWVPPLALDDDLIGDPSWDPRMPPELRTNQARAVARHYRLTHVLALHGRGVPPARIAEQVGVTERQVHRDLKHLRATQQAA
ncbi:MAG: hypothetical protein M3N21_08810 [Actinomycetota bacterium]|nr:hypothetical protein [Actinomycetota bacterium]